MRDQIVDSLQAALRQAAVRKVEVEQVRQQRHGKQGRRRRKVFGGEESGSQRTEGEGIDGAVQLVDEREDDTALRKNPPQPKRKNSFRAIRSRFWPLWKPAWWATI